jgi:hypothetical protein
MKFIIAQFVININADQQASCQSHRQPKNINGGIQFVFPQVAKGGFEVVSEHRKDLRKSQISQISQVGQMGQIGHSDLKLFTGFINAAFMD